MANRIPVVVALARVSLVAIFLIALLVSPRAAFAWGFEGHRIVAAIAADSLSIRRYRYLNCKM